MKNKHTPAPWVINQDVEIRGTNPLGGNRADPWICSLSANPNNKADAKLIAAAPDMLIALEACKARMAELQEHTDYPLAWPRELAQEAINKATL